MSVRRAFLRFARAWVAVMAVGCSASPPKAPVRTPVAVAEAHDPQWEDALEGAPELLAIGQPRGLLADPVYGPLLRRVSSLAVQQSRAVAASRSMEAIESADEVLIVLPDVDDAEDLLVVIRGVRADLDPARLVDTDGKHVWTAAPEVGRTPEYVGEEEGRGSSLFVLPHRTWLIATGKARARAREAFVRPRTTRRTLNPGVAGEALLSLRIDGASLVAHVRPLRGEGPLAPIGRGLRAVTFVLLPGKERAIAAHLAYLDTQAAMASEAVLRELSGALRRSSSPRLRWLGATQLERIGSTIVARTPIPPKLAEELSHADELEDLPSP